MPAVISLWPRAKKPLIDQMPPVAPYFLAAEGFDVYLYHPGYTDRVHNRYLSRHCPRSIHYQKRL